MRRRPDSLSPRFPIIHPPSPPPVDLLTDFTDELEAYVGEALRAAPDGPDYVRGAVRIVDSRNRLFAPDPRQQTDEEESIYALSDLCHLDPDTLEYRPDRRRIARLGRQLLA